MTVITVVYNDELHIDDTINSIITQTYTNIEYIIIDGGSADKTVSIIKKYAETEPKHIHKWLSEKDNGIYDAMNKGIDLATGEWIIFMNSGDRFFASDTLELLSNFISADRQLIYGKVEVRRNNGFKYIKNYRNLSRLQLKYGMPFCHQSLLVKSDLMKQHKYETTKYIAADYNFIVDCYVKGCDFYAIPLVIASISAHGISDNCRAAVLSDWCEIAQKIAPGISTKLYYKVIILRERMKGMIKQILPASLLDIIYRRLCS